MNSSVEQLEGNNVKLTVTVPAAEVDKAITQTYTEFSRQAKIPGFRKGRIPRPVIDARFGREAVLAEALEAVVSDSYPLAVNDLGLRTVDRPEFDELDQLDEGKDYTYRANVETRPHLTLSSTDGISVTVPPSKASDHEVDAQVDYMRERFATLEPVEDRGIERDDFVLLSFTSTIDGEGYEGSSVDKYLYETGRGLMPADFENGLLGHKTGEEVHLEFVVPDTSSNPDFVGKTATFEVIVHEVKKKILPAVDDDLASNLGYDSIDEMRAQIRSKMDQQKSMSHMQNVEREARMALAERLEGEVPDSLVKARAADMLEDFRGSVEARNMTLESYMELSGLAAEDVQSDVESSARQSVREELALEALAREKGLEVVEGDIDKELADLSTETSDAEELRERFRGQGALPILEEQIMRRYATRWLMDNIEVVERAPETAEGQTEDAEAEQATAQE